MPPVRTAPGAPAAHPGAARKLSIVHEDDDLIVVDKPSGLAVHGGSGIAHGLIESLRAARPDARLLELVHRLDRDTSGLLLIAKRRPALTELHRMLREGLIDKRYQVLVRGRWRDEKRTVRLALHKFSTREGERRVRVDDESGRESVTTFRHPGGRELDPPARAPRRVEKRARTRAGHLSNLAFRGGRRQYGTYWKRRCEARTEDSSCKLPYGIRILGGARWNQGPMPRRFHAFSNLEPAVAPDGESMPKQSIHRFDWDGTLADSTAIIAQALQSACRDLGEPIPDDGAARYVIGLGLAETFALIAPQLPSSRHGDLRERYRHHYLARDATVPLFPGARELLDELRHAGHRLAVATGKSRVGLDGRGRAPAGRSFPRNAVRGRRPAQAASGHVAPPDDTTGSRARAHADDRRHDTRSRACARGRNACRRRCLWRPRVRWARRREPAGYRPLHRRTRRVAWDPRLIE